MSLKASQLAICAGLACATGAMAQWPGVDFADETATRLQLTTVPMNDKEEKDIGTGDFDKDGWMDVVVVRKTPFSNAGKKQAVLLMNNGGVLVEKTAQYAPSFIPQWNPGQPLEGWADAREVLVADFNKDGWLDLVFANTFGDLPRYYANRGVDGQGNWLGFANESERFGPILGVPLSLLKSCSADFGDIDNDGDLDIYFGNYNGGDDFIMINDGTGHFTDQSAGRLGENANSAFGTAHELKDVDKDGDLDLFKCTTLYGENPFDVGVYILWNNGSGDFDQIPFKEVPGTASPYMFRIADFNNDSKLDIYVVQDGQDQVKLLNTTAQHNVTWQSGVTVNSPHTGGFGGNTKLADFDKDGLIDIGVSPIDVDIANCGAGSRMGLLRNMGNGQMSDPWGNQNKPWHIDAHDMAFIDINNDGCTDMLLGLCTGWRVFMNTDCAPPPCYADCDQDGVLGIDDFICFQTLFSLGDPYADCDGDGFKGVDDFICFQTMFAIGC